MKATKLIAFLAIAGLGLMAGEVIAQGNDDPPPKMSEFTETEATETEPYNETVTIDKGEEAAGASANSAGGSSDSGERKERLRVYSGKHDGNNVIYDPR